MRAESEILRPPSNERYESGIPDRFNFVKCREIGVRAVRLRRTALLASANEAQGWSSPIPVTILPQVRGTIDQYPR